ncbi:aminoacyl-tRNA hydrolase [Corynebacterium massiliense]|uniref:Peptidyl-tRNA hydrolase n=1 Tax=Corynebacterium massiliense DSM 45435 TaxID=1121364 RepID=A0ABY7U6Z8_9CORY|nr:aminoacyl-tRNA hydrolase [Corynebacterium massiliense]WCZ32171.1 Peptidyl-tRNA hydrolase [Corynebacterium massiliense DSM 45435]
MDAPLLIVGLGNPGPKYDDTRHNIGFAVVEEIASRATPMPADFAVHKKTNAEVAELAAGRLLPRRVVLAKPRTYMNLSGGAVKALANYFGAAPADIIVAHDELELDFGRVRLRMGGGDHGHNGLRSITKSLGTKDYQRLSVGIGRPPGRMDPAAFVLQRFAKRELADVPIITADAADQVLRPA